MTKEDYFKCLIALGLLISWALPEFGKELFAAKTGKIEHINLFTALLLIFGLFYNWNYIKQIIFGFYTLSLIVYSFTILNLSYKERPGYIILFPVFLFLIVLPVSKLIRWEKKGESPDDISINDATIINSENTD